MAGEPYRQQNEPRMSESGVNEPVNHEDPIEEKGIEINKFTIDKLTEENARYWFYAMESQLKVQFSWQAIEYRQKVGNSEYQLLRNKNSKWLRVDMKADMIIQYGLTPTVILEIKGFENAGSKWDYLKKTYLESSNTSRAVQLMRMSNWHQGPSISAKEAFRELDQLSRELIDMYGGKQLDIDDLFVICFLRGLRDEYATFRETIMSSDSNIDKGQVLRRILDFDQLKKPADKAARARQSDGSDKRPKCYNCQGRGHMSRNCPSKRDGNESANDDRRSVRGSSKRDGRDRRYGRSNKQKGRAAEDERESTENSEDDRVEFGALVKEGSDAMVEYAGFVREEAYQANDDPTKWCFDSGATSMSTGNREIFEQMIPCRGTLTIASGSSMPIRGRGTVKFDLSNGKRARLGGVIYVPGLAENLLSLEALHLAGLESRGSKEGYEILRDGEVVAKGKRTGRTTYLHSVKHANALLVDARKSKQHARLALSADEQISRKQELIHSRLGHPGRRRFNYCVESMDMSNLKLDKRDRLLHDNCEICIRAKQVKKQNHSPVPRAKQPLQRVYMDFWGPNRESSGMEKYYLSLIDDCTRYSWLFVTPDRKSDNVILTLDVWLRVVERQTGQVLLVIRTDNASEFRALEPWCSDRGIELEFIEPDTPAQNGVAERFNKFILEVTRALLIDSGVSKYQWKYAVSTANYIRNRTTVVSEDGAEKTPHEMWYGHPPDLTHMRKWGCRVLYYSKPEGKLESRVMEATFMLYGKSDRQYYVLSRGSENLQLVTNPEFRERENGYLGELRSTPLPLMPMTVRPMGKEKPTPTSNPEQAAPRPIIIDNERPSGMMDKPANPLSENMDMNKPSNAESQGESTPRQGTAQQEEMPEAAPMVGVEKPFSGSPIERQAHAEVPNQDIRDVGGQNERVEEEVEQGQEEQSHMEPEARNRSSGETLPVNDQSNHPKETDLTEPTPDPPVQRGEERIERRSARIRQPTERMVESMKQQPHGRKRKTEGEDTRDSPAQRIRANLARLAVATELLIEDREYEITEEARAAREKAGIRIPRSYNEAVNDPIFGSKWKEAIHKELTALISFETWNVIPRREAEGTVSSTRWVFDVKCDADGRISRFKARLVARGNEQSEDDFDGTYAPVFRLDSLRILIAIAVRSGLIAHVLDAKNAFVGSDLDKPNCMEIPEGLQDFDPEAKVNGSMILELRKSLYGLRQSAYLWHQKISRFLMSLGFRPITADPSVFINGRGVIIALYVDDIIIFGKEGSSEIEAIKEKLKRFHPMTDSGLVTKLLGIRFNWGRKRESVRLDQESYARQVLDEFGMANCKPASSPISPSMQLADADGSQQLGQSDHKLFRRLIGRLMFLVIATRPDIAFAVNQLSQYLAEPRKVHLHAAKHVLRYIKSTIGYGLMFSAKGSKGKGNDLVGYADSAYANSARSRSTTGHVFMIDGTPITWASRKQSVTAQSSTEAEYMAVSEATKQVIWIRHFLYSIGKGSVYHGAPTTICEDNQGAIKIADNPINHPKTKHIAVRYHAIRDHISNGEVRLQHLPTDQMVADGLTKATNHATQGRLVDDLGLA